MARTGVVNCDVITLDGRERAEALIIEDGKIALISDSEKRVVSKLRTGDALIDLEGRCVIPGFIDSHTHISTVGMMEIGVDLSGARSKDDVKRKIREGAKRIERGAWLYARGWDESHWNGEYVTKDDLDDASKDRNVVAVRVCGHLATVNSGALARIKGAVERHRGFYELKTGILREGAVGEAMRHIYKAEGVMKRAIAAGQRRALTLGVTSVHDVVDLRRMMAYYELSSEGDLKLRTYMLVEWDDALDMMRHGLKTGYGSEWLRVGGAKMYTDGSIGARTAALGEPYADDPGNCGSLLLSPRKLGSMVRSFANGGFQICAHAIGDLAVSSLVDSLSKMKTIKEHPHRVEHAEMISGDGIGTSRKHGIALSMQPNFIGCWGSKGGMYEVRLGKRRTAKMNPFRKILDSEVTLTFGSDCMPLDPLFGVRSAVDAPHACQRLRPIEALRAYTSSGAALSGESGIKGRVSKGMLADLAILSYDPIKHLSKTRVDATFVNGSIAWERKKIKRRNI